MVHVCLFLSEPVALFAESYSKHDDRDAYACRLLLPRISNAAGSGSDKVPYLLVNRKS